MEVNAPQMQVSAPTPQNVLSCFEEQDQISCERIGVSQRWYLYLLY